MGFFSGLFSRSSEKRRNRESILPPWPATPNSAGTDSDEKSIQLSGIIIDDSLSVVFQTSPKSQRAAGHPLTRQAIAGTSSSGLPGSIRWRYPVSSATLRYGIEYYTRCVYYRPSDDELSRCLGWANAALERARCDTSLRIEETGSVSEVSAMLTRILNSDSALQVLLTEPSVGEVAGSEDGFRTLVQLVIKSYADENNSGLGHKDKPIRAARALRRFRGWSQEPGEKMNDEGGADRILIRHLNMLDSASEVQNLNVSFSNLLGVFYSGQTWRQLAAGPRGDMMAYKLLFVFVHLERKQDRGYMEKNEWPNWIAGLSDNRREDGKVVTRWLAEFLAQQTIASPMCDLEHQVEDNIFDDIIAVMGGAIEGGNISWLRRQERMADALLACE